MAFERGDHLFGVRDAVEGRAEIGSLHDLGLHARGPRDVDRRARSIRQGDHDRESPVEHRLEDGSTPGSENADPHASHPSQAPGAARLKKTEIPEVARRIPGIVGHSCFTRSMERTAPTPGELTILIAGGVMFLASFLTFAGDTSAWGSYFFPVATLLPIYGMVMAAQIALSRLLNASLPRRFFGYTWEQFHLVVGFLAALMAVGWFITDVGPKGIGLWVEALGGIALAFGAVTLQRERNTGAIG